MSVIIALIQVNGALDRATQKSYDSIIIFLSDAARPTGNDYSFFFRTERPPMLK